jgi:hypothetical protein
MVASASPISGSDVPRAFRRPARLALAVQQEFGRAVEQQQAEPEVRVVVHGGEAHGFLNVNDQAFQALHEG